MFLKLLGHFPRMLELDVDFVNQPMLLYFHILRQSLALIARWGNKNLDTFLVPISFVSRDSVLTLPMELAKNFHRSMCFYLNTKPLILLQIYLIRR